MGQIRKVIEDSAEKAVRFKLDGLNALSNQAPDANRNFGCLSPDNSKVIFQDGTEAPVQVVGRPISRCGPVTSLGDGTYHMEGRKPDIITTGGSRNSYLLSIYFALNDAGFNQLFIQRGTSSAVYTIDPTSLGFPSGVVAQFANFSADGTCFAIGAYTVPFSPPAQTSSSSVTIHWCVYQNFTLTTNSITSATTVESSNIITGSRIIPFSGLPLCTSPGSPALNPFSFIYFTNPFTFVPVGSEVIDHSFSNFVGKFAFNRGSNGSLILDFTAGFYDSFSVSQPFGINCPTDPSLDTAYFLTVSNINERGILFAYTDLLNIPSEASAVNLIKNFTWKWIAPPVPVTDFTTDVTGIFVIVSNGGIATAGVAGAFLGISLNRESLVFDRTGHLYLVPNYTGTIDPTVRIEPVVFTDSEFILSTDSPFIDNTHVHAKNSEVFYVYFAADGKANLFKYLQNSAVPPTLAKSVTIATSIFPIDNILMDWIIR